MKPGGKPVADEKHQIDNKKIVNKCVKTVSPRRDLFVYIYADGKNTPRCGSKNIRINEKR